ncbi:MAG: methylenetetrahydrofolate--tRNA-(uracil(54)-C(5))-methyltransferase (FADH(2)-oxidizing) TrmFO [Anaerolineales bacterium]
MAEKLTIIGGGLAGSEAAWQAAQRGIPVRLYEMRPVRSTGAHTTDYMAELVCSNSLGSNLPDRASGLLKAELRRMASLVLECADATAVPAGGALAVSRDDFARLVTRRLLSHPGIELIRQEVQQVPARPVIVASGPLTATALSEDIARVLGRDHLYFYDALAPIVYADSVDMTIAFRASRYERNSTPDGQGDYINCPFTRAEYEQFIHALQSAERIELHEFEQDIKSGVRAGAHRFFEGCLPAEVIAARSLDALAFGAMRPVGLQNPQTGQRPYAVVQLRQDNLAGSLYNLVGFQTNLTWPEQRRVLRMIPGLQNARFARYGMMHRNTFINAPKQLRATMQARTRDDLFFAGQITGVEGYVGNVASGWVAGVNAARLLQGRSPLQLPKETMTGALCRYVAHAEPETFQPMKANFGLLPELAPPPTRKKWPKRERYARYAARARRALDAFIDETELLAEAASEV